MIPSKRFRLMASTCLARGTQSVVACPLRPSNKAMRLLIFETAFAHLGIPLPMTRGA